MRVAAVALLLSSVLALVACGSETSRSVSPQRLPRPLAERLAADSDTLAATLARSDECAAKTRFHRLERRTRTAISAGEVPPGLRSQLQTAVRTLGNRLPACI